MEKNSKIMVIDDEPTLRQVISEMLMQFGWSVATASNPDEALAMIEAEQYHMAFVDHHLGSTEGLELIERIQKIDPELPCVLMTGDLNIDATVHALRKGAAGFLRKPFRVESLLVSIEHANKTRDFQRRSKELLAKYEQERTRKKESS
jgi:DNA-binding NtrC family response regulator